MSVATSEPSVSGALGEFPDFYGNFLAAENIFRMQPDPEDAQVLLQVGADFLQSVDEKIFVPSRQGRFMLNAILASPDGAVTFQELLDFGFAKNASYNSRRGSMTTAGNALVKHVNKLVPEKILTMRMADGEKSLVLADCVELERLEDISAAELQAKRREEIRRDIAKRVANMEEAERLRVRKPALTSARSTNPKDVWKRDAKCYGLPTGQFYAERNSPDVDKSKKVCRDCPIKETCGEYAVIADEKFGIWGEQSERQRRRLRRERGLIKPRGSRASS